MPPAIALALSVVAILFIFYVVPGLINLIWWSAKTAFELVYSLIGFGISICYDVVKWIVGLGLDTYKSLITSYPLIFITTLVAAALIKKFLAPKIKYWWIASTVPVLSVLIGELAYGRISINVSISDAGLLLATVTGVFVLYYLLIKSGHSPINSDSLLHSILRHSFIIVLVLLGGAFGIAAINLIIPAVAHS